MSNLSKKLFFCSVIVSSLVYGGWASAQTVPPASTASSQNKSVKKVTKSAGMVNDPLSGDVWHAVLPSWPGTMQFDEKSKMVTLRPMGSDSMTAAYTQTIKRVGTTDSGEVVMTLPGGQVSKANVIVEGKKLSFEFKAGQRKEIYIRMSKAEEAAYIAKLPELLKSISPSGK